MELVEKGPFFEPSGSAKGYSYGESVYDSFVAAHDIYAFLQIFFQELRQYTNLDFHIAGESYAGHYIPAIASVINNYNNVYNTKNIIHINLKSILMGNSLVNILEQHKYLPVMGCDSSYGPILTDSACNQMRRDYIQCAKLTKTCYDSKNVSICVTAETCFSGMFQPFRDIVNIFDIRDQCNEGNPDLCYPELQDIVKYCNREDIKTELGVNSSFVFQPSNFNITDNFFNSGDAIRRFDIYIPPLLENNIRVLVYAGDADVTCNWFGCEAWTKALKWSGAKGFNNANVTRWVTNTGNHAGNVRSFKGFTFLRVFDSGHMVPHDQPRASLDFYNKWIFNKDL
ncbi:9225_t:CDS:2 [Cetraspora pellucida]|uniref:9225_t:CDS:1 n=1 Tax=Cetraspora pellucida TaxID=1433469 RepID=A0ACA9M315_9GLOM|nr:9225_t:CDS:2 [Cetraspora pellucida]